MPRNADGSFEGDALIKVRLVHAQHGSILLPDHILVRDATRFWLQPQWISPPILHFAETNSTIFHVAVAHKIGADPLVEVLFGEDGFVADLPDRSQLYAGRLAAPIDVTPFGSGRWRQRNDGGVDLRLYHHTSAANKKSILSSGEVWGSAWNFQGNKRLRNVSYAYFTSLDRIADRDDLKCIAMGHDGRPALRLDQSPAGLGLMSCPTCTANRRRTGGLGAGCGCRPSTSRLRTSGSTRRIAWSTGSRIRGFTESVWRPAVDTPSNATLRC